MGAVVYSLDADYSRDLPRASSVDRFLADAHEQRDLADSGAQIPGLIHDGDRVIITAEEGAGKSELLAQISVCGASRLHPFTGAPFDYGVNVALVDLENSERQVADRLERLIALAGGRLDIDRLRVLCKPEGIDFTADDFDPRALMEELEADLICIGPLYKMARGDLADESVSRRLSDALDRFRDSYTSLIIEAHRPHENGRRGRPARPYGSSLWLRWPEVGLQLAPGGALTPWRPPRVERAWPVQLRRGDPRKGEWPWVAGETADELWDRIVALTCERGPMSQRDLAKALSRSRRRKVSPAAVNRVLKAHHDDYFALTDRHAE